MLQSALGFHHNCHHYSTLRTIGRRGHLSPQELALEVLEHDVLAETPVRPDEAISAYPPAHQTERYEHQGTGHHLLGVRAWAASVWPGSVHTITSAPTKLSVHEKIVLHSRKPPFNLGGNITKHRGSVE